MVVQALYPPPQQSLLPPPPLSPDDLSRFPPAWYARQAAAEADRHLKWVEAWIAVWKKAPPSGYAEARLLEACRWRENADRRRAAWAWLVEAHRTAPGHPGIFLSQLRGLQTALGPSDYLGGRMPVPVPVELMGPRPPLFARPHPD
jgi:hypothetical protein